MKKTLFKLLCIVLGTLAFTCGSLHAITDVQLASGGFLRFEDWRTEQPATAGRGAHEGGVVFLKAETIDSVKVTSGDRVELIIGERETYTHPGVPRWNATVYYWQFTTERGATDFAEEVIGLIDEALDGR